MVIEAGTNKLGFYCMGFLVYLALFTLFVLAKKYVNSYREAFVYAAVVWGVLILFSTSFFSFFHMIAFFPFLAFWLFVVSISTGALYFLRKGKPVFTKIVFEMDFVKWFIVLVLILTFIIAIIAAPNNWDSMTYHLSRVSQWIENRSVAPFATSISRQNFLSPLAEYTILHLQILNYGFDNLANTVQWLGFLGCTFIVSLIVKIFNGDQYTQSIASLVVVTIPMAILQSTSTQNDLYCSFWFSIACYFCMKQIIYCNKFIEIIVGCAALFLAAFTKFTSLMFFAPILLSSFSYVIVRYFLRSLKKCPLKTEEEQNGSQHPSLQFKILFLGIFSILIIFPITSFFYNNLLIYNNFTGPLSTVSYVKNESFNFRFGIVTFIKNYSMHFGTPIASINQKLSLFVEYLGSKIGVYINDPKIFYKTFTITAPIGHEDTTGNPIHAFLLLCVMPLFFIRSIFNHFRINKNSITKQKNYSLNTSNFHAFLIYILLMIGYLLYSMELKWEPWNTRYETPFFILQSVPLAFMVTSYKPIKKFLPIFLFLYCIPFVFFNFTRPLISLPKNLPILKRLPQRFWDYYINPMTPSILTASREVQYFANHKGQDIAYVKTLNFLNQIKCKKVALYFGDDSWNYPLYQISLRKRFNIHFWEIVDQQNPTYNLMKRNTPCAIVMIGSSLQPTTLKEYEQLPQHPLNQKIIVGDMTILFSDQ